MPRLAERLGISSGRAAVPDAVDLCDSSLSGLVMLWKILQPVLVVNCSFASSLLPHLFRCLTSQKTIFGISSCSPRKSMH